MLVNLRGSVFILMERNLLCSPYWPLLCIEFLRIHSECVFAEGSCSNYLFQFVAWNPFQEINYCREI